MASGCIPGSVDEIYLEDARDLLDWLRLLHTEKVPRFVSYHDFVPPPEAERMAAILRYLV